MMFESTDVSYIIPLASAAWVRALIPPFALVDMNARVTVVVLGAMALKELVPVNAHEVAHRRRWCVCHIGR
jgi:hypothetical protein